MTDAGSLTLFLAICSFTPSFVFFVFSASSGAVGLLIAAVLLVFMLLMGVGWAPAAPDVANALAAVAMGSVFIIAHGAVAGLGMPPNSGVRAVSGRNRLYALCRKR